MNPIEIELRELASIRSHADPIISVYLDTRWSDEMQRDRVRLFVQQKVKWAREQGLDGNLGKTLDRVEEYVDELCRQAHSESENGVAIFACEGLGLWKTLFFQRRFEKQFVLDEIPHLLQAVRLVEDYEPVVIAMVDSKGARIFETAVGAMVAETQISHDTPRRHSMGGWSQFRYQRHIDQLVERNLQEAAEHVTFLLDRTPGTHLVVVGPDRTVSAFQAVLPPRVAEKTLATMPHPGARDDRGGEVRSSILEMVVERLVEYEREVEEERAHRVVGEALAGGLAALGPEEAVLAANEDRVHLLVIEEGFQRPGWRCGQCGALASSGPIECNYCGGGVETIDLGEALTRRVIRAGGEVDVVAPHPRLHHYHGVGAFLRHRGSVQRELGVASPIPVM